MSAVTRERVAEVLRRHLLRGTSGRYIANLSLGEFVDVVMALVDEARTEAEREAEVAQQAALEYALELNAVEGRLRGLAAYLDGLAPGDRHYAARIRAALDGSDPRQTREDGAGGVAGGEVGAGSSEDLGGPESPFRFAGKDVTIRYEPDLWRQGETYGADTDTPTIVLKAWDERVFLHELLHIVAGPALIWHREQAGWQSLDGTLTDPEEQVVQWIEAALWDDGWRRT